jgi:hypothetical protein
VRITPEQVRVELESAGFREVAAHDILPHHYFLTAVK